MEPAAEWTFEGRPERTISVGTVGNPTRYQEGAYVRTCESGRLTN